MEEDKFALVEKILKDVETIMSKNAELCSFDIVPVDTNFQNKSPVLHLENCLGLESWCVKHVYMYCYTELMDKYFSKPKRKSLKVTTLNAERLAKLLNITLLFNPELSTLWNKRREMVEKNLLDKTFELRFSRIVLTRKPKCNDAFAYRRWLLKDIFLGINFRNNMDNCINEELNICGLASEKSPNNYHSWSHRMWLLQKLKSLSIEDMSTLHIKEYDFSQQWTAKHVSDFSCYHYRQFCIKNMFSMKSTEIWKVFENTVNISLRKSFVRILALNFPEDTTIHSSENDLLNYSDENLIILLLGKSFKNNCSCPLDFVMICRQVELLFHELSLNNELIRFYKQHETLWYHRRFIIHELMSIMYEYFGLVRQNSVLVKNVCGVCQPHELLQKQVKIVKYDSNCIFSSLLFNILITHERNFYEERSSDGDNYADRHEKYLKFVEGLNFNNT